MVVVVANIMEKFKTNNTNVDPFIRNVEDTNPAKFGHINAIVEVITELQNTPSGSGITSITSNDGSVDIDDTNPSAPDLSVGYKSYVALLTQSGTSAPVATVLFNNIGEIGLAYNVEGEYFLTSTESLFVDGKTVVLCSSVVFGDDSLTDFKYLYSSPRTQSSVLLQLFKINFSTLEYEFVNGFTSASIEIRVYP